MIPFTRSILTERQSEVLNLLDIGESSQRIASRLGCTECSVSQTVGDIKEHFYLARNATDVNLIQFYRESIGDVPDANDPIEGEVISNDVAESITMPIEIEEDLAQGVSLVPDALNGPDGTVWRLAIVVAIPLAVALALILALTVLSLLSDSTSGHKLSPALDTAEPEAAPE